MKNSLEIMFPEVAKQWSTRNFPLLPKDVSYGSNKRFGGVESADTNGRQVLIAEPEKTLPVVRIVPETVCLPVLTTLHRGFQRSRQNGRRRIIP